MLAILTAASTPALPAAAVAETGPSGPALSAQSDAGAPQPPAHAEDSAPQKPVELRAAELLSAAQAEIALGERWSGQRLLEILVARYPDVPESFIARRLLGTMYASGILDQVPLAGIALSSPTIIPATPTWHTHVLTPVPLQDQLRQDAGDRVFFAPQSVDLGDRARSVIAADADWLARNPAVTVVVEGHADDGGTEQQAAELAAQRAEAVRQSLVAAGVDPARLTAVSRGAAQRVALCAEPECAAQNRRVVLVVTEPGTER